MHLRKLLAILAVLAMVVFAACGGEEAEVEETQEEPVEETSEVEETEVIDPEEDVQPEMTEEEKLAWVMENCICPQCPSWVPEASEKGEGGYCAVGISECIVDEVGCVCPDCPVTEEMGLEWGYYCTRGSAEEMRAEEGE